MESLGKASSHFQIPIYKHFVYQSIGIGKGQFTPIKNWLGLMDNAVIRCRYDNDVGIVVV